MKYIVVLGDGMADEPLEMLGGKTPLEYASTPQMDRLASQSEIGMAVTIPEGMAPGSDTANLSVLGYDPQKYYTGRSPLEALSIGAGMEEGDVAFRCNLVTLTEKDAPYEKQTILDHSSDEIRTEDAKILLQAVLDRMEVPDGKFYVGTSYRHCMIWKNGMPGELTPPHDILEQEIGPWLPSDPRLLQMQKCSYEILKEHPLNLERKRQGKNPANSFWFWGAGTRPALPDFRETFGKRGIMISAVDLLKGIAIGAGMDCAEVPGANGGLDTNYEGKAQAAVDALLKDGYDLAYLHIEAPDKNIITRAIGAKADVEVDFYEHRLKRGDIILMCTDGLSNMVEDEELFHIVQGGRDIVESGTSLVETAKENGGTDNIGVVLTEPFTDEVSIC